MDKYKTYSVPTKAKGEDMIKYIITKLEKKNKYLKEINVKLLEALKAFLDISHRLHGCRVSTCSICKHNKETIDLAKQIILKAKINNEN